MLAIDRPVDAGALFDGPGLGCPDPSWPGDLDRVVPLRGGRRRSNETLVLESLDPSGVDGPQSGGRLAVVSTAEFPAIPRGSST